MPWLILLALGGSLAAYAAVASTRKNVPAATSAVMSDLFAKYTTVGPKGERVFTATVAEAIIRTLASQVYHYVGAGTDPSQVQVSSDPGGVPPSPDISALSWARNQNKSMAIMAPVYMAEASPSDRFLRAIAPGNEAFDGGVLYAVLAYGGAIATGQVPGTPAPPGTLPPPIVAPAPLATAQAEMPPDLAALYQTLLHAGTDPTELLTVAAELDAAGCSSAAELLRKRAADLQAVPPVLTPPGTVPVPGAQPGQGAPPSVVAQAPPTAVVVPVAHPLDPTIPTTVVIPSPVAPLPAPAAPVGPAQSPPAAALTVAQKAAAVMNTALAAHGYKQADQSFYRAFQASQNLTADGYPGQTTMAHLTAVIAGMGLKMAPVKVYPWASKPGLTGYDGINAPTVAEWTGNAVPAPVAPPAIVSPAASNPLTNPALANLLANNPLLAAIPGMPGPALPPPPVPTLTPASAMNAALAAHGYNVHDQPFYKAFQASKGLTADGFPGQGTMTALTAQLAVEGVPFCGVPIYPWSSRGSYDGVNAPLASQWNA